MTGCRFLGITLIGRLAARIEQGPVAGDVGGLVGFDHRKASGLDRDVAAAGRMGRLRVHAMPRAGPRRQAAVQEANIAMPRPAQGPPGASGLRP